MSAALVTGGARRVGRAIVERLAQEGYAVAIHFGKSHIEAEALASRGARMAVVQGDLADPAAPNRIMEAAGKALGPITLLINNASEFAEDEFGSLSLEQWDRHFAVNLRAPVFLAQALAQQLPDKSEGAVVNLLDQRVLRPTPRFFSYTLTKSALFTATRTMAQALAPRIRVNAIGPGPTLPSPRQDERVFQRQVAALPLRRGPAPEEIADAVIYLARAKSVTGQMIALDGGQHLAWNTPDADVTE